MPVLDFASVVALGAAIAALLTVVSMLLTPTLGGSGATRLLAAGNLCFTTMLVLRLFVGDPPSHLGYAAIWSMLLFSSATHWFAVLSLGEPRRGARRAASLAFGAGLLALWVALWASPTPHSGAIVAGLATFACHAAATRASLALPGRHLALPRRTLAAAFGASGVFAALHVVSRVGEIRDGIVAVPATAITWFGAILLFCTVNVGFLLLLYLRLAERVRRLAQVDELTGALNRRGLAERAAGLRAELEAGRGGALLLIDIDRFKSVNDTHGHAVGDEVLRWFAATLRRFMRQDDLLTRMGGEEFCLLLPGVPVGQARQIAERIRLEFEAHDVAPTSAGSLRITASFGVAAVEADDRVLDARLRQADEALYAAKRGGRNRVVCWAPDLAQVATV